MKVHASMSFGAKHGGALMQTCLAKSSSITSKWGAWNVQDDIGWDEVDRCMCVVKAVALIGDRVFLKAFLKNLCVCVCVCVGSDVA